MTPKEVVVIVFFLIHIVGYFTRTYIALMKLKKSERNRH